MSTKESGGKKIIIIAVILVLILAGIGGFWYWKNRPTQIDRDLSQFSEIEGKLVDLNTLDADFIIAEAGSYTFNGETEHSIVVDVPDAEVKLILNDVKIQQTNTAAIIGKAAQAITIELAAGSENTLADGGSSNYDACIFSNADLYFTGSGNLTVIGQQEEGEGIATESKNMTFDGDGTYFVTSADDGLNAGGDGGIITINGGSFYIDASGDGIDSNKSAVINGGMIFVMSSDIGGDAGIDTDDGYTINGGSVIALGSDMLEAPLEESKQTAIAITLDQTIDKDTTIALTKDDKLVTSFQTSKNFKTLVISNPDLTEGSYSLEINGAHSGTLIRGVYYVGEYSAGEKVMIDGSDSFAVASGINNFGRGDEPGAGMGGRPNGGPVPGAPGMLPGQSGEVPPEQR